MKLASNIYGQIGSTENSWRAIAAISKSAACGLVPLVESRHVETCEFCGKSGKTYQIEIQFLWDNKQNGKIRVIGSIDDGGIRAYFPLTETLLIS